MVAKKDYNLAKHPDVDVKNLEVIKAMQSLTSRGLVKTQFSWQYYYYALTNEGVEYLRAFLHLPAEIVPRTFLKTAVSRPQTDRPRESKPREAGEYRRRDDKKEGAAGADFKPEFVMHI